MSLLWIYLIGFIPMSVVQVMWFAEAQHRYPKGGPEWFGIGIGVAGQVAIWPATVLIRLACKVLK